MNIVAVVIVANPKAAVQDFLSELKMIFWWSEVHWSVAVEIRKFPSRISPSEEHEFVIIMHKGDEKKVFDNYFENSFPFFEDNILVKISLSNYKVIFLSFDVTLQL